MWLKVTDLIAGKIQELDISQKRAAELCGMTRQQMWDVIERRNPKFRTARRILEGLGFRLQVETADGDDPGFDQDSFMQICTDEDVGFDTLDRILKEFGYSLAVIDPEKELRRMEGRRNGQIQVETGA